MGCDIHFYVEKQNQQGGWDSVDEWEKDEYDGRMRVPYKKSYYHERNYNLFAILADVRNNSGFAGCDMGDRFNPISDPRGLPHDVSPEVRGEAEAWEGDGHSHSWFRLSELLFEYDWTQTATLRGWVNAVEFFDWSRYRRGEGESPSSYSGGVSGRDIKYVSVADMEKKIAEVTKDSPNYRHSLELVREKLADFYCQVEWKQPYYACTSSFWSTVIPRLLKLAEVPKGGAGVTGVRIVFWFDN